MDRRARALALAFALSVFASCVAAQGVTKSSDDDDDDPWTSFVEAAETAVDVLNIVMFVFAGGPEEVAFRVATVVAVLVAALGVLALGHLCCGVQQDTKRKGPRARGFDNLLRAIALCENAGGCAENAHKYFD